MLREFICLILDHQYTSWFVDENKRWSRQCRRCSFHEEVV